MMEKHGTRPSPKAQFALVGHPVEHSLSPDLHRLISEAIGVDCDYGLFDIKPDHLKDKLPKQLDGFNVTVPHKQSVIPLLENLSDEARRLGAVNTVHRSCGYNTDILGLRRVLPDMKDQTVLLIGYGGVAEALAAVALERGCKQLLITGRNRDKASVFSEKLIKKDWAAGNAAQIHVLSYDELGAFIKKPKFHCDVILQATSAGLWPHCATLPVPEDLLEALFKSSRPFVFESIYNPATTRLLLRAKTQGFQTENGLAMLFWQGLEARRIWQPELNFSAAEQAAETICAKLAERLRSAYPIKLVLTGFMGSGKTRLLTHLAEEQGKRIVSFDLDAEIVRRAGKSIPDIFATEGEAAFRKMEADALDEILAADDGKRSLILATGGGTLVQDGAAERIRKHHAQVIYLNVSLKTALERIGEGAKGRPMLSDTDAKDFAQKTAALYNQRQPLYQKVADLSLDADQSLNEKYIQVLSALGWR